MFIFRKLKTSSLRYALEVGNFEQLRIISNKNDSVDYDTGLAVMKFMHESKTLFKGKITPLQGAVALGHIDLCKYLIEEGVTSSCFSSDPHPLCVALRDGHEAIARLLIKAGADVNLAFGDLFPMYFAVNNANCTAELVESIISAGFPKDGPVNSSGFTTLHFAVDTNNFDVVHYLINISSNPNVKNFKGLTPLHLAVKKNHIDMVKLLGAYEANLNCEDNTHYTPLMMAMALESHEMVKTLISLGADIHYATSSEKFAYMPLHFAANTLNLKGLKLLLEKGADVNRKVPSTGEIALHSAARAVLSCNHEPKTVSKESTALNCIVYLLIEHNSDVKIRQNNGLTPLQLAVKAKHVKLAISLVKAGSDLNDCCPDGEDLSLTTFHLVAELLDKDLIKLCIDYGADCNSNGGSCIYPCHKALMSLMTNTKFHSTDCVNNIITCKCEKMLPIFKLFWANGFPFDLTLKLEWKRPGKPPIPRFIVSHIRNQKMLLKGLKTLDLAPVLVALSNGADAQFCSSDMNNPLHYICSRGISVILKVFLKHGLSVNYLDSRGETLLHKAVRSGSVDCCQILLEYGAVYNYSSAKCLKTPLQIAKEKGNRDLIRILKYVQRAFKRVEERSSNYLSLDRTLFEAVISCCGRDGLTLIAKALKLGFEEEALSLLKMSINYKTTVKAILKT